MVVMNGEACLSEWQKYERVFVHLQVSDIRKSALNYAWAD